MTVCKDLFLKISCQNLVYFNRQLRVNIKLFLSHVYRWIESNFRQLKREWRKILTLVLKRKIN